MYNEESFDFKIERDVPGVISGTFDFLKQEFKGIYSKLALIVIPFAILSGYLSFSGMRLIDINELSFITSFLALFGTSSILLYVGFAVVGGFILGYIKAYLKNEGDKTDYAIKNLIRFSLMSIGINIGYAFMVGVGFLLFIIPGIFFLARYYTTSVAYIIDDYHYVDSFKRSGELTHNNWWQTFGLLLLVGIIYNIINYLAEIPSTFTNFSEYFAGTDNYDSSVNYTDLILLTVSNYLTLLIYPISIVPIAIHYFSLESRNSVTDLQEDIDKLDRDDSLDSDLTNPNV